ncbi:predicted protein [Sclerotinia sclerotiorum 1980 UF-70]|uniref:Uncharacterized protein n=1 Tax=Sclerotinia sclerotiorum (strain ATCC 18683 / 1980 / Ss-1) TaxID=665079 RepID=A7EG13_SCLS1|nr:predicted protein [Sclerotinia sclerotiorum 1980 UF-70]EDO01779.1 predicted protein [Sclerotinia sclerotiorum 1980 UF-70]
MHMSLNQKCCFMILGSELGLDILYQAPPVVRTTPTGIKYGNRRKRMVYSYIVLGCRYRSLVSAAISLSVSPTIKKNDGTATPALGAKLRTRRAAPVVVSPNAP